MASISFQVIDGTIGATGFGNVNTISGSGLGFYGAGGFGSSVSTTSYQDNTFITNADGTAQYGSVRNVKFLSTTGCFGKEANATGILTQLNGSDATLFIHFDHTTAVKVQNCQLRIYDRASPDSPAVGVITKVAEVINFGAGKIGDLVEITGTGFVNTWLATPGVGVGNGSPNFAPYGYGDSNWWGSPWPSGDNYLGVQGTEGLRTSVRPGYTNSVGIRFSNFTDYQYNSGSGNPDSYFTTNAVTAPGYETVGGSGIIVPLMDSPGSDGRLLAGAIRSGVLKPKYIQYVAPSQQGKYNGGSTGPDSGNLASLSGSYGLYGVGSGYDTRHTWRVAISARPLSIGSKKQYGLYVSLEYL
jgi:hypothetical protein